MNPLNSPFNIYEVLLFAVLVGGALLHIIIELLNLFQVRAELPQEFIGYYDAEKYRKSQLYLRENTIFDIIQTCTSTPLLVGFIVLGGFNAIDHLSRSMKQSPLATGLIFTAFLSLGAGLLSLPFSIYRTFVIEEKFGFNKTTAFTFVKDLLKGLLLGAFLGGLALTAILWFFQTAGENAWLWSWLGLTGLQLILFFLAPAFIMPLFNKFTPLPAGPLKDAIEEYAKSQNFKLQGIFTMDGSKRSTKANAYFTGFGRFRRIVLFDTLIHKHSTEELVAVLAHEIGHFKLRHIFKQLFVSILASGVMFFMLSLFMENKGLFEAFRMEKTSIYASIVFFGFLYSPLSQIISLVSLSLSRRYEYEADAFARKTYGRPEQLIEALKKLSVDNLSNLTPHPLKVFTDYTHPPILSRISKLRSGLLMVLFLLGASSSFAREIKGTVYNSDNEKGSPSYKFESSDKTVGDTRIFKTRYLTQQGELLVDEETIIEKGKLKRYSLDQKQIHELGTVEVKDERLFFTKKHDDKIETDDEKMTPNALVLGQMEDHIRTHWGELMKGDDLNVRFAVVSRMETVGFKFFKDKEIQYQGKPAVVIKAKPSALFISLFVKPLYLVFERDGDHYLRQVDGRMPIKYQSGDNDWSDIEALLVIQ